jgi:hypothetical protein
MTNDLLTRAVGPRFAALIAVFSNATLVEKTASLSFVSALTAEKWIPRTGKRGLFGASATLALIPLALLMELVLALSRLSKCQLVSSISLL